MCLSFPLSAHHPSSAYFIFSFLPFLHAFPSCSLVWAILSLTQTAVMCQIKVGLWSLFDLEHSSAPHFTSNRFTISPAFSTDQFQISSQLLLVFFIMHHCKLKTLSLPWEYQVASQWINSLNTIHWPSVGIFHTIKCFAFSYCSSICILMVNYFEDF